MTPWVRLWREMPNDPKFRAIAKKSGRPLAEVVALFVAMMTAADEAGEMGGWDNEDAAAGLDMEPASAGAIWDAMQGKVLEGNRLKGWERRQPKREDDSAARVRAHRERKKQDEKPNGTLRNADVTHGNAPDTDSDSEKDTDKGKPTVRSESDAAREDASERTDAYAELKREFNGATKAMIDQIEADMGGGCRPNAVQWLSSTVAAHGAAPVAQAFAMIVEKRARGEIVARVLPHWSKLAGSLKAGQSRSHPPDAKPKRTIADALAAHRAQGAAA